MKIVTLDIGGTAVKSAVWQDGVLTRIREQPTAANGAEGVLAQAAALVRDCPEADAVGVSTRGAVSREGVVLYDGQIAGYGGFPLRQRLAAACGLSVTVENDVNCAAVGEGRYGAAKDEPDFLCLTYGTGVGGAIVRGRQLEKGCHGIAGEFGGMRLLCGGEELCYEDLASTTALVRLAAQADPALTDGRGVAAAIRVPTVYRAIGQWADHVAMGLCTLTYIFDPACIVLGGGIFQNPEIAALAVQRTRERMEPGYESMRLTPAALGNRAALMGAAQLALETAKQPVGM